MIKEDKKLVEIINKRRCCDVCEDEMNRVVGQCELCGNDLCGKCVGHEDDTLGDYSIVYCKKCWELGAEHRFKITQLENEIERISEDWHKQCNL